MNPSMRPLSFLGLLTASLLLSGCFRYENDPGEGGVTIGEARELDEIAADLDARPQAPGVSLDNASDDSDMTGAVTQEARELPVPANPAAIKDAQKEAPAKAAAEKPDMPKADKKPTEEKPQPKAAPAPSAPAQPSASTAKAKEAQATPRKPAATSAVKTNTNSNDVPLKKSEPKPAQRKPTQPKPVQPKPTPQPAPTKDSAPAASPEAPTKSDKP